MFRNCYTDRLKCAYVRVHARRETAWVGQVRRKNLNNNDFQKQRLETNMPLNSAHSCTFPSVI